MKRFFNSILYLLILAIFLISYEFISEFIKEKPEIQIKEENIVTCVRFSPDDRYIASSTFLGNINLWDLGTEKKVGMLKSSRRIIDCIDFSFDGKFLASSHRNSNLIKIWS